MSFTRQHYIKVAAQFRKQPNTPEVRAFVAHMADMFAADNERFDRGRFEQACRLMDAPPFARIPVQLWNEMVMQGHEFKVGQQVLDVSFLSHANGVFNSTVGLLVRMGLLYEGHECTYDEFTAAFSKLVVATACYKQEHENDCANCHNPHSGGLMACRRALETAWPCDHCPQPGSMACLDTDPTGLTACKQCGCAFGRDGLHMRARTCERTPIRKEGQTS